MIRSIEESFADLIKSGKGCKTKMGAMKRLDKVRECIDPNDIYTIIVLSDGTFWPVVIMRGKSQTVPGALIHNNVAVFG